ncbi:hypothetical protein ACQCSX_20250 [Pseudarthrobacter sp. P1]|uniref:hypothetical protein n=1 Tax=Pseudarthrobacter sp. P1 TaxID=3418418 RepID=UPI003CECCE4D
MKIFHWCFQVFFLLAFVVALAAGATLALPGTGLDAIWAAKPEAHRQLLQAGWAVPLLFGVLSVLLLAAAIGLIRRRRWAPWLAGAIFAVNAVGDLADGFSGQPAAFAGAAVGAALAAVVLGRRFRRHLATRP